MEVPQAATMDDVNYVLEQMHKLMETQFQSMTDRHKKLEQRIAQLEEKLQNSNAKSALPSTVNTSQSSQIKAPKPAFYSTLPRRTFMQTFVASTSVGENHSNSNGTAYGSPESISRNSKPFHLQSVPPRRPALMSSALVNTVNANESSGSSSSFSRSKSMTNLVAGNSDGEIALVDAAKEGDQEKLRSLLESGANPNVVGAFGHTALYWAINNNFPECVRILLEAGAKVEDRDYLGKTSLHRACVKGHAECVEELLYHEADVNAKDHAGNTALHEAACYGHVDCVRALVRAKATRNEKNEAGETAQGLAVRNDHEECAQIIRCGAVDKRVM